MYFFQRALVLSKRSGTAHKCIFLIVILACLSVDTGNAVAQDNIEICINGLPDELLDERGSLDLEFDGESVFDNFPNPGFFARDLFIGDVGDFNSDHVLNVLRTELLCRTISRPPGRYEVTTRASCILDSDIREIFSDCAIAYIYVNDVLVSAGLPFENSTRTFTVRIGGLQNTDPYFDLNDQHVTDQAYIQNRPIDDVVLPEAYSGSSPSIYSLTPALPPGLHFDPVTRILSGTPSEPFDQQTYRYTVSDTDGSSEDQDLVGTATSTLTFRITVALAPVVSVRSGTSGYSGANDIIEGDVAIFALSADPAPEENLIVEVFIEQEGDFVNSDELGVKTVTIPPSGTANFDIATIDDGEDEPDGAVIMNLNSGNGYATSSESSATITVRDNDDRAGVEVSATSLSVTEQGASGSYTVELLSAPDGTATVTATSDNPDVMVSPSTLTFTADNWDQPVTVTVTAGSDPDAADETATIRHAVSGYDAAADPVVVSVTDDDRAGVEVSATSLSVTEQGASGSYTVELLSAPDGTATVTATSDNPDVMVSPSTLTFTADNWDQPVTVTVTAGSDPDAADETAMIRHAVSGYDAAADPVVVSVTDDDRAGVEVSATSLSVTEQGASGSYTVELLSAPDGTATVTATSDNPDVMVSPSTLTFTADNWDQPVTVTVTAGSDPDAADETATIRHAVSGYDAAADPVVVSVTDDDQAGVEVSATSLSVTEQGASGSYTVELLSAPDGTATVTATSDNPDVMVSPSTLTFTADNWDQPVTVTVTAGSDPDAADETAMIRHTVSGYGNVTAADPVSVTVMVGPAPVEVRAVAETLQAVTAGSLSNVTTNIGTRFSAARSGGTVLTLAGQPVFAGRSGQALAAMERSAKAPVGTLAADEASWGRTMSAEQLLQTSTFELSLNAAEDGSGGLGLAHWTLWGRGDILVFDSDPNTGPRYDGDLKAGYLGVDAWINGRWLVGVAASRTQVDAEYRLDDGDGALDVTLTSVHPYVRFAPDGRRELWAILGAGTGEVENAREGASERESTDVEMYMAAAGVRQALEPLASGVAIALLGDAGFGRLNGDAGSGLQTLDNLSVDTWRARAGAEVSYTMAREGGTSITPFAEIAGRVDGGGEDDTKAGVEVSAGVAYADPASGFGLEARGRTLVLYSGGDYREYGASLTASLSPGAGGEGLSLALSPRLGIDPGRTDVLWREDPFRALNTDHSEPALSLDAEIGYGISVASGRGLATPFGELRVGNGASRRARAGIRFGMPGPANRVNLEFAGARQEDRINVPEHRVELIGRVRF